MARKTKEEIIYGDVKSETIARPRDAKEYDVLLFDYIEKELRGAND